MSAMTNIVIYMFKILLGKLVWSLALIYLCVCVCVYAHRYIRFFNITLFLSSFYLFSFVRMI